MKKELFFFLLFPFFTLAQNVGTLATDSGINDGLALDEFGNLYGSKYNGSSVFKLNLADGSVSNFASGFNTPNGSATDNQGNLFLADDAAGIIYKITPDGTSEVFVEYPNPSGLAFIPGTDTMVVASYFGDKVSKISPDGEITDWSIDGIFQGPVGICFDGDSQIYISNFDDRKIIKILPDGSQELLVQGPSNSPLGFITYSEGFIYGTLITAHQIMRTDLDGNAEIFLGSTPGHVDGDATVSKFNRPNGITASSNGDTLYISEVIGENIRMITNLEGAPSNQKEIIQASSFSVSPNPISENTLIEFELLENETLSLELRNAEGKLIQKIIDEEKLGIGQHQVKLNQTSISSGIYFIQLKTNGQVIYSEKLIKS